MDFSEVVGLGRWIEDEMSMRVVDGNDGVVGAFGSVFQALLLHRCC